MAAGLAGLTGIDRDWQEKAGIERRTRILGKAVSPINGKTSRASELKNKVV
jgi:hypothetical protein